MKDSPTEPPLKKLKQARLPFQILSPPVVKNVESPPSQCKRKACEAASDDEVVISEINENKIKPVEKKAKTATEDESHKKNESSDVCMEVEKGKNGKKVSEKKRQNKKESNPNKLTSTPKSSRKSAGKGSNKAKGNKNKPDNSPKTPAVVDFIDLSDSPVKAPSREKEPKSVSNDEVNISADLSDDKGNQSEDCATSQSASSVTHAASDDQLQEVDSKSSDENKTNNDKKIESEETKIEESEKDKSIEKSSSTDPVEESVPQSKSTSSNDQTSSIVSSPKQSSIEKLVTSLNSKSNSTPDSLDISKNKSDDECDIKTDEEVQENKSHDSQALDDQQKSPSTKSTDSLKIETNLKTPSTANDSLMSDVSSPSSECNTSSLSTPGSDSIKKISKTPRRMTPKQLLKVKELEEKRKERERMKEEKEKKRAEEREEKLKLKREKEEERLKLKQEKEDEKRKEKEEKEKKRQAELDQKNEEKRLKEEEKRLKEEEKRQKEEEKRVKDEEKRKREEEERKKKEEKRLKEEQKEAEKRKSAQAFASFFVKAESKPVCVEEAKENTPLDSNFQPFEVKNDMRLAPLVRTQLPEDRRQLLDSAIESAKVDSQRLYLELIRSPSYVCGSASRTYPPPDDNEDDVIIIESEMPNEEMEVDENKIGKKTEKRRRRAKLLQFHENRRPPYWGTWRKKSKHIRPRAPLKQDKTILEYEVDSDDEWEEPEEGESLRGSDEEEEQDDQYEEDNDMFVPHGYLSDGEGDEDELDDNSPESMKAKLKVLQLEFETERKQKQEKLKPRLIGCIWFCNSETVPSNDSNIAALFLARRAVWEGSLPITVAPSVPSSPSTSVSRVAENTESKSGVKKKLVNESLIPNIIRKIHGSRKKLSKLLLELMEEWEKDKTEPLPSKNCLVKRIRELAVWEKPPGTGPPCWFVNEEVRAAYGLVDLALPSPPTPTLSMPSPAANITKFTKVLTTDERLKLLRESPASSKEPPKEPKTPSTPAENLKTPNKTVKTPTVKLATASPVVKKRAHLITIGPKESPKQSATTSMMNFVTKSAKSDETESPNQEKKVEEKVKKRITPITLTSSVHKLVAPVSPSTDDCIVIDD